MKRLLLVLPILLLISGLAFAGGGAEGEAAETETTRVVVALSPTAGETLRFWTAHNWEMLNPALEPLVGHDPVTGEFTNSRLAESWSHNDDMTEWTFKLREGVQFHHGWGEVTAEDVVHSYNIQTGDDAAVPGIEQVRGGDVTAVDEYTVRFSYDEPRPNFLFQHAGRTVMFIYSKAQYDAEGFDGYDEQLVGTGQFEFVERSPGRILYRRVENHYSGQTPNFEELELQFIGEPSSRLAMLRTGEAHISEIPRELHSEVVGAGLELIRSEGASMQTNIALNGLYGATENGDIDPAWNPEIPWTDIRVREAMNVAINREEMLDVLFDGRADLVAVYGMREGNLGYDPALVERFEDEYAFDPGRARRLLQQANYPDAFDEPVIPLVVMPLSGQPEVPVQMQLIQGYFEEVGLQTEIVEYDTARVGALGRAREAYLVHPMRNAPIRPSLVALEAFYGKPGGPYQGFEDDAILSLIDDLRNSFDPEERQEIAEAAWTHLFEEFSSIPLFEVPTIVSANPEAIAGWTFPGVTNAGYSHWHLIEVVE
jgi:peptide/nickel transport system substrate-binding protein